MPSERCDPEELTLDSRLAEVARVGQAVRDFCARAGLGGEAAADLDLAVTEALNNVIVHGHRGEAGHPVRVGVRAVGEGVEVRISDRGTPIPAAALDRAREERDFDPADLDGLPESGMGLMLVHRSVDRMEYEAGADGNRMVLVKRW